MSEMPIWGSITALVTPFKNGKIDSKAFQNLVKWQLELGTHGFVPCGTTGEASTLAVGEHEELTKLCVEVADGKAPIIVGSGSNNPVEAIKLTNKIDKAGATASLQVVPYYVKPSQEGMYQHFKMIHDETCLPIILYNVPGRTVVDMLPETVARLSKLERVVGIKDATGDLTRPVETARVCGKDFIQLSGDDATTSSFLTKGGVGAISVLSNLLPNTCSIMHKAHRDGDHSSAEELSRAMSVLAVALFDEPSPGPAKFGLSLMGKMENELRLPMTPITSKLEKRIESMLVDLDESQKILKAHSKMAMPAIA